MQEKFLVELNNYYNFKIYILINKIERFGIEIFKNISNLLINPYESWDFFVVYGKP